MIENCERLSTLIADLDGTALDSRKFTVSSFVHAIREVCDYEIEEAKADALFGLLVAKETFRALTHPGADLDTLCKVQSTFQMANLHLVTTFPGVTETLAKLKERDIKIAAVTGRTTNTHQVLEAAGILPFFGVIVSGDDTTKHKPHPQGIRMALGQLNRLPAESVMVGDQRVDIQAGKRAGTKTAGVTYGILGRGIGRSRPDYRLNNFEELLHLFER